MDIGCGNGAIAELLAKQGYQVTGIDLNQEAIQKNQERSPEITYLVADCTTQLPFEDGSFDAIVVSFVLVNIIPASLRAQVATELERLVKPGGLIWVNEGTVSEDYQLRYDLARPFLGEERTFYVFKDKQLASQLKTVEELRIALEQGAAARVAHHFSQEELIDLFKHERCLSVQSLVTTSPNTHMKIAMLVAVFQKSL